MTIVLGGWPLSANLLLDGTRQRKRFGSPSGRYLPFPFPLPFAWDRSLPATLFCAADDPLSFNCLLALLASPLLVAISSPPSAGARYPKCGPAVAEIRGTRRRRSVTSSLRFDTFTRLLASKGAQVAALAVRYGPTAREV